MRMAEFTIVEVIKACHDFRMFAVSFRLLRKCALLTYLGTEAFLRRNLRACYKI